MATPPQKGDDRVVPGKVYLRVGAALLVLTGITVGISQIPLGGYNLVIALTIATAKAMLVALFFMHLLYDNRIYLIIVGTAVGTLGIFIILTLFDTLNRGLITREVKYPIREQAVIYQQDTTRADTTKPSPSQTQGTDTTAQKSHEAQESRP